MIVIPLIVVWWIWPIGSNESRPIHCWPSIPSSFPTQNKLEYLNACSIYFIEIVLFCWHGTLTVICLMCKCKSFKVDVPCMIYTFFLIYPLNHPYLALAFNSTSNQMKRMCVLHWPRNNIDKLFNTHTQPLPVKFI